MRSDAKVKCPDENDCELALQHMEATGCYAYEAAEALGLNNSALSKMLKSEQFSVRYNTTKRRAAQRHEALALAALEAIPEDGTKAETARQIAIAQHHWKAAKVRDNKRYGDKVDHEVSGSGAITIKVVHFTQQDEPLTIDCSNSERVALVDNAKETQKLT